LVFYTWSLTASDIFISNTPYLGLVGVGNGGQGKHVMEIADRLHEKYTIIVLTNKQRKISKKKETSPFLAVFMKFLEAGIVLEVFFPASCSGFGACPEKASQFVSRGPT